MNWEQIYEWGLSVITAVQKIKSPFMTGLMEFVSFFGDPIFYFIALMWIFWCLDRKSGFKLGTAIIFSGALNGAIKNTLQVPRPFQRDASVFIVEESGFSTPSGHSQGSASFYPVVSDSLIKNGKNAKGKRFLRIAVAVFIPLLIGFSRIYLGVHYPTDVMLGLIFGFLTSGGILLFWDSAASVLDPLRNSLKLLILTFVCLGINYFSANDSSMSGLLFGFVAGYIYLQDSENFDAGSGTWLCKILRVLLGMIIVFSVYSGLKILFNYFGFGSEQSQWYPLCRFIRYGAVGFSASFIAPKLFLRFNLVGTAKPDEE